MKTLIFVTLLSVLSEICGQYENNNNLFDFLDPINVEEARYNEMYDFIIVGSGPGGCALANRLTENKKWNVLIIEAGDVETPLQEIPIAAAYSVFTKYNWGYITEPQKFGCLGRIQNRCAAPHGKALGGSSVINLLMHTRGNPRDFDRWHEAGNYGWKYQDVLPYFIKSEKARLGKYSNSPFHNKNGLLGVSLNSYKTSLTDVFMNASKSMGLSEVDFNSNQQIGVSYVQSNILNGRRHSAFKAFLEPILSRKNLHIMVNTRVTKVLIDPQSRIAYGVELRRNGKKYRINSKREVILSGGTFHTPQLLTLSGIGRKRNLQKLGIPTLSDLNVGENMHDHPAFAELLFLTNETADDIMTNLNNFFQYFNGRGLLTLPSGIEAFSFIKAPSANDYGPTAPDLELIFIRGGIFMDGGFGVTRGARMRQYIYDRVYRPLEGINRNVFLISLILLHPQSLGRVEVPSSDPLADPKIYSNTFENSNDVETLLYGIKYVLKLVQQEPFQRIGARLHSTPLPQCAHIHFASDDYWRCAIRNMAFSIQHQIGTAKMGPKSDPTSVVDPELRVHNIKNLRVVDCSVVPEAPSAHTNAISVMIGEKAADLIKKDWWGL